MSYSNLDKEGLYDQSQRYRFHNIDDEVFVGKWNGTEYVTVPAGESVTLPESQAINFAKQLATRVMIKDEQEKFVPTMMEPTWEQSRKTRTGIPMAREPYEKRILKKIEIGEETPEIQSLRSQIREELISDMSMQVSTEAPQGPRSKSEISIVADKNRPQHEGKEFEGVSSLK